LLIREINRIACHAPLLASKRDLAKGTVGELMMDDHSAGRVVPMPVTDNAK